MKRIIAVLLLVLLCSGCYVNVKASVGIQQQIVNVEVIVSDTQPESSEENVSDEKEDNNEEALSDEKKDNVSSVWSLSIPIVEGVLNSVLSGKLIDVGISILGKML